MTLPSAVRRWLPVSANWCPGRLRLSRTRRATCTVPVNVPARYGAIRVAENRRALRSVRWAPNFEKRGSEGESIFLRADRRRPVFPEQGRAPSYRAARAHAAPDGRKQLACGAAGRCGRLRALADRLAGADDDYFRSAALSRYHAVSRNHDTAGGFCGGYVSTSGSQIADSEHAFEMARRRNEPPRYATGRAGRPRAARHPSLPEPCRAG